MTEAWGIVIAAIIAVAGTAVGYSAGRRQVRDQALVEHGQWLRAQRQEAYYAFLTVFDGVVSEALRICDRADQIREESRAGTLQGDDADLLNDGVDMAERLRSNGVAAAQDRVAIIGEETITAAAAELLDTLPVLISTAADYTGYRGLSDGPARPRVDTLVTAKRSRYVATVRTSLLEAPAPHRQTPSP